MQRFYKPEDIRQADITAVKRYGVPSLLLMENAGSGAVFEILREYPNAKRFVILAGPGNNGGDGFVAARYLLSAGMYVSVITSSCFDDYKNDAKHNLSLLLGITNSCFALFPSSCLSDDETAEKIREADVVIDALLGTGTSGAPRKETARLIKLLNFAGKDKYIVSFDTPSGIDSLNGSIFDIDLCVRASLTLTFLAPKTGMCLYPASEMCGKIVTAGIGVQPELVLSEAPYLDTCTKDDIKNFIPALPRDIHKGRRGGVLVVGGSINYRGAPLLAALGALRTGAGLVVLAVPDFMIETASSFLPEAILVPLKTTCHHIEKETIVTSLSPWINRCNAAVFGPGIGQDASVLGCMEVFFDMWDKTLIVDADALRFMPRAKIRKSNNLILTPHHGEAAAIMEMDMTAMNELSISRMNICKAISDTYGVCVLKGMDTLVAYGESMRVIKEGSPSLSVAGSGDVLSGTIGALSALGLSPYDAASAGALLHAAAGSHIESQRGISGILAREIADAVPSVLKH